ncbi:TetR/AcrR family transcriptional regulator [Magnetococcus sp. PR-3]|uniref:TetR/AcrR family transcriptional regulator n=1 Tax=Magnetococcus sp. PR-3 TaxID=3120355 RepID=UPI002FCE2CC9
MDTLKDKKTRILEAAIYLFARDGFWKTSTASIAKEAQVATGTLFHYFSSKDILIDAVYIRLKKDLYAHIMANWDPKAHLREKLLQAWTGMILWAQNNPTHYDLMEQLRLSELVSQETREAMAAEFTGFSMDMQMGIKEKIICDLPVTYHLTMAGALINATITFLRTPEGEATETQTTIAQGFHVYWQGITTH